MPNNKKDNISSNGIKEYLKTSKVKGQNNSRIVNSWENLRLSRLAADHHITNPVKINNSKIDLNKEKMLNVIESGKYIIENLKK